MSGFPINIKDYNPYDHKERLYYESMPLDGQLSATTGAKTAGQTLVGYTPPASWKVYIQAVSASVSDANITANGEDFLIQIGSANLKPSGILNGGYRVLMQSGTTNIIPINDYVHEGETVSFSTTNVLASCKATFSVFGKLLCNDNALNARYKGLIIGDSISANTVNVTYSEQSWWWIVRNWLWSQGVDIRMVNKSRGSYTSLHTEWLRRYQRLYVPGTDLIFYALGMNDGAVSLASFQANFPAIIAYKQLFYPKALMIICGPSKSLNSTSENVLVTIRSYQAALIAATADPQIKYVDFAAIQAAAGMDTVTNIPDNTHPSIAGHASMGNGIIAAIQAGNWLTLLSKK